MIYTYSWSLLYFIPLVAHLIQVGVYLDKMMGAVPTAVQERAHELSGNVWPIGGFCFAGTLAILSKENRCGVTISTMPIDVPLFFFVIGFVFSMISVQLLLSAHKRYFTVLRDAFFDFAMLSLTIALANAIYFYYSDTSIIYTLTVLLLLSWFYMQVRRLISCGSLLKSV